jgi:hypothetical protein
VRGRSRSAGDWKKVDAVRALAAESLGREKAPPSKPLPKAAVQPAPGIAWIKPGPSVRVFTTGEVVQRLEISKAELDARIARGEVKTLPVGSWGMVVVPTSEVERLHR